jgi:circadian clock protein KaiC
MTKESRGWTMAIELQRVHSGVPGLDDLLYGGFLEGDTFLLAGAPGSGKTSLGIQYLFAGATQYNEPGIFITFEEFPERIYRDAANFGWDLQRLQREDKLKVIFTSPDLVQQDLLQDEGIIAEMIHEIGARRVVVDSISLFESHPAVHGNRREAIYGMMNALKREGLTSILIRELSGEGSEIGSAAEDFVADGVIMLTQERVENQRVRFLEVMKSRSTPHMPFRALMLIEDSGLRVIPAQRSAFFHFEEAMSTGISRLDDLLGGGIPYGSQYLLEVSADFHTQLLEANFLKECLEAGDTWIQIGALPALSRELTGLLSGLGVSADMLDTAAREGRVHILGPVTTSGEESGAVSVEDVVNTVDKISTTLPGNQRLRLQLELSSLIISLGLEGLLNLLTRLSSITACGGVMLGLIQSGLVGDEAIEKVRSLSDGIVRIWKQGDFDYLQVQKTVNSVRTRIQPILETPEPPYLEILS